jgi:small subunit ribosomal protein S11
MADDESKKPEEEAAAESADAPEASQKEASQKEAPQKEAAAAPEAKEAPAKEAPAKEAPAGEAAADAPATEEPKGVEPAKKEGEPGPKKSGENAAADILLSLDPDAEVGPKIIKAKSSKKVHTGIVHVLATFNNTIVTVSDMNGNVIGWSTSGKLGFRGSRKSTAYASQLVSQDACRQAMGHGLRQAEVRVKGPGSGRESAVRAVQAIGIEITVIKDVTPIPHNGCRPPKARRV